MNHGEEVFFLGRGMEFPSSTPDDVYVDLDETIYVSEAHYETLMIVAEALARGEDCYIVA